MEISKIVNTQPSDLPFIYWLFDEAIAYQKKNNYSIWFDYDKKVLQKDIQNKMQYKILIEDKIASIFTICYTDKIVWRKKDNENAIYLHRLVVNPNFKGRKLFGQTLEWAKKLAKQKKLPFIRMDTWADNPTIIKYYRSYNFKIVDYYTTPDTSELPIQQRNNHVVLLEHKINL